MPTVGAKLLLSDCTLLGRVNGPRRVTGSTLKRPVKAAVLTELMGVPKFS